MIKGPVQPATLVKSQQETPFSFKTDFSACAVKFSPFKDNLIAVASSQYFGIVGNGRVVISDFSGRPFASFSTSNAAFDVVFSEANPSIVGAACGDGSLQFFDIATKKSFTFSKAHSAEAVSLDWSVLDRKFIVSTGWDGAVKIWDMSVGKLVSEGVANHATGAPGNSSAPFNFTAQPITPHTYQAVFSPHALGIFGAVSGDGSLTVFDVRSMTPEIRVRHGSELLSLDWNKYRQSEIVTVGVDKHIRVWDTRNPVSPVSVIPDAHSLAIRRVKCHPFKADEVLTCSYDMSVCQWDILRRTEISRFFHHSEFCVGLDMSLFNPGFVASAGWDKSVKLWSCS